MRNDNRNHVTKKKFLQILPLSQAHGDLKPNDAAVASCSTHGKLNVLQTLQISSTHLQSFHRSRTFYRTDLCIFLRCHGSTLYEVVFKLIVALIKHSPQSICE